jgi:hypothetical protein
VSPRRLGLAAAILSFVVLAATAPGIPIVWDEGEYLWRTDLGVAWFKLLATPADPEGGLRAFSEPVVTKYWKFTTWDEGHPAGAAWPMAAAKALGGTALHTLTASRLGTMVIFSLACGAAAFRLSKTHGTVAGVTAPIALLTVPRLFAEAHFATLDGPLTAWWVMLWAAETTSSTTIGSSLFTGVAAGMTSAAKFTGWVAWGPMGLLRLASRDRRRILSLLVIVPAALLTFYFANPPLWHHPIDAARTHVQLNMHRTLNVSAAFLGQTYDLHRHLPWYNSLVWWLIVTPLPLLVLGLMGVVDAVRSRQAAALGLVLNWAALMIVKALPQAPPHDGVRLFVSAFAFWALLAAIGTARVWTLSRSAGWMVRGHWLRAALVVLLAADAVTVARYYPQTLSHYNLLVGGVRGAARLGMEPTYFWDGMDDDVLDWINTHTGPGERIAFSSTGNIRELRSWGRLKPEQADRNHGPFKWFVQQNRTGFIGPSDHVLIDSEPPAFVKYPGHRAPGAWVPPDLRVPLIRIYTGEQYDAAVRAVTRQP